MSEARLKSYVAVLAAAAVTLVACWVYQYGVDLGPAFFAGTAVLAGLIWAGDAHPVRVGPRSTIGVSDVGLLLAVAALGPVWAALAALPADLAAGGRNPLRTAYEASHTVVIVFLAGTVLSLVAEPVLGSGTAPAATVTFGVLAAGVALVAANRAIDAGLLKIRHDQAFHETWSEVTRPYLLSDALNVLTAGAGVLAFLAYGPIAAVVATAGATASQALVYWSQEQAKKVRELLEHNRSLEQALATSNMAFGVTIVRHLGSRDGYTHRHAAATAVYAADLAREMGLDEARAGRLRIAGLLHNVGMFELPEDLLLATGRLNSVAQGRLREHPALGERALSEVPEFEDMARWVRWHHERPDGRGYPDKLRGAWIPVEAKILAVAQAYAAMVLDGPHRPGMDSARARKELAGGMDAQFDGAAVKAFLRILDTESEGYRMADDHRFAFPAPGRLTAQATPAASASTETGQAQD